MVNKSTYGIIDTVDDDDVLYNFIISYGISNGENKMFRRANYSNYKFNQFPKKYLIDFYLGYMCLGGNIDQLNGSIIKSKLTSLFSNMSFNMFNFRYILFEKSFYTDYNLKYLSQNVKHPISNGENPDHLEQYYHNVQNSNEELKAIYLIFKNTVREDKRLLQYLENRNQKIKLNKNIDNSLVMTLSLEGISKKINKSNYQEDNSSAPCLVYNKNIDLAEKISTAFSINDVENFINLVDICCQKNTSTHISLEYLLDDRYLKKFYFDDKVKMVYYIIQNMDSFIFDISAKIVMFRLLFQLKVLNPEPFYNNFAHIFKSILRISKPVEIISFIDSDNKPYIEYYDWHKLLYSANIHIEKTNIMKKSSKYNALFNLCRSSKYRYIESNKLEKKIRFLKF